MYSESYDGHVTLKCDNVQNIDNDFYALFRPLRIIGISNLFPACPSLIPRLLCMGRVKSLGMRPSLARVISEIHNFTHTTA